jgi:hypothetical protein
VFSPIFISGIQAQACTLISNEAGPYVKYVFILEWLESKRYTVKTGKDDIGEITIHFAGYLKYPAIFSI